MCLNELMQECHRIAKEKGFWDEPRNVLEMLCLVHSELSEALEEYRISGSEGLNSVTMVDEKPEGFGIELADACIRLFDIAEGLNVDLMKAIRMKMAYNERRERKHGKVR